MSTSRAKRRSNDEWLNLITECRQSGLTDDAWCRNNGIPVSSFYNAVHRLRESACSVPERAASSTVMDLTASAQEVVQFSIIPEPAPEPAAPATAQQMPTVNFDNSHTIEISVGGSSIRIRNDADPQLLERIISILRCSR